MLRYRARRARIRRAIKQARIDMKFENRSEVQIRHEKNGEWRLALSTDNQRELCRHYRSVIQMIADGRGSIVDVRWFDRDGKCRPARCADDPLKLSGHMVGWFGDKR